MFHVMSPKTIQSNWCVLKNITYLTYVFASRKTQFYAMNIFLNVTVQYACDPFINVTKLFTIYSNYNKLY